MCTCVGGGWREKAFKKGPPSKFRELFHHMSLGGLFFFLTPSHTHLKLAVITDGDVYTVMTITTLFHLIIKDNPARSGLYFVHVSFKANLSNHS